MKRVKSESFAERHDKCRNAEKSRNSPGKIIIRTLKLSFYYLTLLGAVVVFFCSLWFFISDDDIPFMTVLYVAISGFPVWGVNVVLVGIFRDHYSDIQAYLSVMAACFLLTVDLTIFWYLVKDGIC